MELRMHELVWRWIDSNRLMDDVPNIRSKQDKQKGGKLAIVRCRQMRNCFSFRSIGSKDVELERTKYTNRPLRLCSLSRAPVCTQSDRTCGKQFAAALIPRHRKTTHHKYSAAVATASASSAAELRRKAFL